MKSISLSVLILNKKLKKQSLWTRLFGDTTLVVRLYSQSPNKMEYSGAKYFCHLSIGIANKILNFTFLNISTSNYSYLLDKKVIFSKHNNLSD